MVLHASSRLGTITYLYQNKDLIAYALGLVSERPITECSSEFYFADRLTVADESSEEQPNALPLAREIHLFFVDPVRFVHEPVTHMIVFPAAQSIPPLSEGVPAGLLRPPIFS